MNNDFSIINVGLNEHGAPVIRILLPGGRRLEVATNTIGFAKLAQYGCAVNNDTRVKPGKV